MTETMTVLVFVIVCTVSYRRWQTAPPEKKSHAMTVLRTVFVVGAVLVILQLQWSD
jgi:hypothetical protein